MVFFLLLQALESSGQELVAVSVNMVDVVWGSDRPSPPCNPLLILPLKYSGEGVEGWRREGCVIEHSPPSFSPRQDAAGRIKSVM